MNNIAYVFCTFAWLLHRLQSFVIDFCLPIVLSCFVVIVFQYVSSREYGSTLCRKSHINCKIFCYVQYTVAPAQLFHVIRMQALLCCLCRAVGVFCILACIP